jgi:hypothetical protein
LPAMIKSPLGETHGGSSPLQHACPIA